MPHQTGLSATEVADRISRGLTNSFRAPPSRTFWHILRSNICTRFNLLLGVLFVVVLLARSPADGLFGLVVVTNSVIGITQETRAKRKLDSLALLHQPTSVVIRDGLPRAVRTGEIVLDDLVQLRAGDEIPADGTVVESHALEVDESNLTGESEPVPKEPGGRLLSGCFVVAGYGTFRTTRVGARSHANSLAREARIYRRVASEIEQGLDRVMRWVGWAVAVAVPLQVITVSRIDDGTARSDVLRGVAGLVGVVPEGLVLLSTLAFLAAAVTLTKRGVLVQELQAVEGLARVNVVCVDKTGTLTSGIIGYHTCETLGADGHLRANAALGAIAHDDDNNATLEAVRAAFPHDPGWHVTARVPFESGRKWKATHFGDNGCWYLGAPEVLAPGSETVMQRTAGHARAGRRVLLLCSSATWPDEADLPADITPVALVVLKETVRPDARDTLRYLSDQGVRLVVLSGDNPLTVGAISHEVGIGHDGVVDARTLHDETSLRVALGESSVFGRVTPEQKKEMVGLLQRQGNVVAMTGDGVNDTLALKSADVGIAMGNAAPATKAVAQFVLLDNSFAVLPAVLAEGRRVIANVERVAQLFLAKNAMSFLAIVVGAVSATSFPVLPRQMTLLSTLTIGIPAFLLALGPNTRRFRRGFLSRIVSRSVPVGAVTGLCVIVSDRLSNDRTGTAATITALVCFFALVRTVAEPLTAPRMLLVIGLMAGAAACVVAPGLRSFFGFALSTRIVAVATVCAVPAVVATATAFGKGVSPIAARCRVRGRRSSGSSPS